MIAQFLRRLDTDRSGVALIEFALVLPLFSVIAMVGLEMSYFALANNRVQRLAAMTGDLVAQSGTGSIGMGEGQIYDLFSALDLTAKPFDLRTNGRVVITAIQGTDANNDGTTDNTIRWQRFDGAFVAATPMVGCAQNVTTATLKDNRKLPLDEFMFHVQVSYKYQPLFSLTPMRFMNMPTDFVRTATFRARSKDFLSPTPDSRFPPKYKCNTATGL